MTNKNSDLNCKTFQEIHQYKLQLMSSKHNNNIYYNLNRNITGDYNILQY